MSRRTTERIGGLALVAAAGWLMWVYAEGQWEFTMRFVRLWLGAP